MSESLYQAGFTGNWAGSQYPAPPSTTPVPPPTGLKIWLKADAGTTVTAGRVSAWADQSGSGNNYSEVVNTGPIPVVSAINGLPALGFNGTTQYMTCPFLTTGAKDVWLVRKLVATPGPGAFFTGFQISATGNHFGTVLYYTGTGSGAKPVTFADDLVSTTPIAGSGVTITLDTAWHYDEHTYNGSGNATPGNYTYSQDGTAKTVAADLNEAATSGSITLSSIGVDLNNSNVPFGDYANIQIAEYLVYDHVLSAGDRTTMVAYLHARYGL
jgi:hypothetical protein